MTFDELVAAAKARRSVVGFHTHNRKPMPAAFVISMPGIVIARVLKRLELYGRGRAPESEDTDAEA